MEIQKKITVLSENLNNLRSALEDFRDHHISKKEKIKNLISYNFLFFSYN